MTSTTRVPAAEITGLYGAVMKRFSTKMLGTGPRAARGDVAQPARAQVQPRARPEVGASGTRATRTSSPSPTWRSASLIGCTWCLDLGYFQAHNEGLDEAKAREVPRWRESDVFTPLERDVMEYAEAMTQTPPTVTDELSGRLLDQLGAPAMVELTAWVALANLYARDQRGARASRPQGFAAACGLAAARPAAADVASRAMTDDPFVAHRSLLFTVAYEMLGSAADAEDVVQETWLRWADAWTATTVRDPRAYLVRIVTRQALNRLRTLARRREEYVGEWLPEPLLTSPDVAEDVELAESVSIAMLTVLETLGPTERAVFVLREVFDTPYDEIAEAVGKTPAAVRQIAHRAREHVAARRPRQQVEPGRAGGGRRAVPGRGPRRRPAGPAGRAGARRRRRRRRWRGRRRRPAPDRSARTGWPRSWPAWPGSRPTSSRATDVAQRRRRAPGSTSTASSTR